MKEDKHNLIILMSTYNGEKYLREQLKSLYKQSYKGFKILVRDDGSTDKTVSILQEEKEKGNLEYYQGTNIGVAKSFWNLLLEAPEAEYYAFCDQDDYWEKEKVSLAIQRLNKESNSIPLLYVSNVKIVDQNLKLIRDSGLGKVEYIESSQRALIKSLAPGCTFVFNKKSIEILRKYQGDIDIHDWMAHKIISLQGKVIKDGKSTMLYRQHDSNVIGARSGFKNILNRVVKGLKDNSQIRKKMAINIKKNYYDQLSTENKANLEVLCNYDNSKLDKKKFYNEYKKNFNKLERLYFKLLVKKGKI